MTGDSVPSLLAASGHQNGSGRSRCNASLVSERQLSTGKGDGGIRVAEGVGPTQPDFYRKVTGQSNNGFPQSRVGVDTGQESCGIAIA